MGPFSCSVCDDELTSVSTLHYHQMCLHTTEELSLAILSLRELPVNPPSPSGGGEASGNVQSPSTDCEDKLLRNGLAKYPRFLLASGDRKQKLLNLESKNIPDCENSAPHKVRDKENIINNKSASDDINVAKSNDDIVKGSLSSETRLVVEPPCENLRSRLWGAIKTLDGKTVEAPVVKIDSKRQVLKPCFVGMKETHNVSKSTDKVNSRLNVSHDSVGSSTVPKKNAALLDLSKFFRKECDTNLSESENSAQLTNSEDHFKDDRVSQGFGSVKKTSESLSRSPELSDGHLVKGNILEKQLEMMNMSSFDDVIELECSDDSDDERERFSDEFCEEDESLENEEVDRELITEKSLSKESSENEILGDKDRRVRKKQKSLMSLDKVTATKNPESLKLSDGKESGSSSTFHNISKEKVNLVNKSPDKSVKGGKIGNSQNNGMEIADNECMNDEHATSKVVGGKSYSDSCVQTDRIIFSPKKYADETDDLPEKRKANPKKKTGKRKAAKKDSDFNKSKKPNILAKIEDTSKYEEVVVKAEVIEQGESVPVTAVMVNGEKRFFCDQCNKTYKKRSHLDRHKRVHTGERPFVCSYCEKGFSVRSILNQHIRIHTGEKPYSCSICAARFPQKSGLMTHMMLHTGKPFKCDQCDKSFVSNHKLIHHLKGHDGDRPYTCDECSSAFFTAAALNDHKQMHSRSRKLVCKRCNASFVHEVYLKIHLATHMLEHESPEQKGTESKNSSERSTSSLPALENANDISLSIDALDQFCNGETIMMDLSV